jgi:hypothetical protein
MKKRPEAQLGMDDVIGDQLGDYISMTAQSPSVVCIRPYPFGDRTRNSARLAQRDGATYSRSYSSRVTDGSNRETAR